MLLLLLALVSSSGMAALINVDSLYRITEVKSEERVLGIALPNDNPNETQNEVTFGGDTRCYREMRFANGTRKEVPMTIEKFFKIIKKGDQVRVKGGRDWDGTIRAHEIRLQSYH